VNDVVSPADDPATRKLLARLRPPLRRRRWTQARVQGVLAPAAIALLFWVLERRGGPTGWAWGAACFAAACIAFAVPGGVIDQVAAAKLRAERRRRPAEPWAWDHAWDPAGAAGSWLRPWLAAMDGREARYSLAGLQLVGAVPLLLLDARELPFLWMMGVTLTHSAWLAWRVHGFGTAHLSFTEFPYAPGGSVALHFGMSEGGASFRSVAFRLRRIRETVGPSSVVEFEGLAAPRRGGLPGPNQDVEIVFDVPADAGGTRLSASPPEYWRLDVAGDTSAGAYAETFLVPIYERPRAP
jgi:hypothetical protein